MQYRRLSAELNKYLSKEEGKARTLKLVFNSSAMLSPAFLRNDNKSQLIIILDIDSRSTSRTKPSVNKLGASWVCWTLSRSIASGGENIELPIALDTGKSKVSSTIYCCWECLAVATGGKRQAIYCSP